MKKLFVALGAVMLLAVTTYISAEQKFLTLDKINVSPDSTVIALSGKTKYHAFKISNPPRLVVEFPNTEFNVREKEIAGSGAIIRRVRGGQFKNEPVKVARVVIELAAMSEYELTSSGNEVIVKFNPNKQAEASAVKAAPVKGPVETATKSTVKKIPVEKKPVPGAVAAATVVTPLKPAAIPSAPAKTETPVPAAEDKIPEVKVLPQAETVPPQGKEEVRPAATNNTAAAPVAVQQPKKTETTAATKAVPAAGGKAEEKSTRVQLPTKPVTLDFEEADIRDVLRMLSLKSGINIIYGADVTGTVSIRLENVPFDKAFETIMSLKNLVSQEQGPNILRVVTPQKIADERAQAVTFTKIFPLNYAKGDEVKANLDSIRNAEGRRGNVSVDARTNSLIVTDTPEGLLSVEQIIVELDKKPQQVLIEAKIVELVRTDNIDLGIQWQYANTLINNPNQVLTVGATKAEKSDSASGGGAVIGGTVVSPLSTTQGGTGVTFPATAVNGQMAGIAFGLISDQMRLTGMINALAQKGMSRLLSTPKITTINNRKASILVGQKIPYTTTTVTPTGMTQQTNFLDVGVKLNVTPTINKDRKITLDVKPEVSLFVRSDPAGPVVGTREAQTTVIVSNGETVVIGGLITDDDRKLGTQVPLLGDLPIIGHLFKRQYDTKEKTELLVFLTPQIIE